MARIRWAYVLLAGVTVAAVAPRLSSAQHTTEVSTEDRTIAGALAGCYDLLVGTWSQPLRRGPTVAPSQIRLDSTSSEPLNGRHLFNAEIVRSTSTSAASRFPPAWWPVGTDSVQILTWSTGFEAEILYMKPEGDGLRGVIRRTTDARPVDSLGNMLWDVWPFATVRAERVACPTN